MDLNIICNTGGDGLWSSEARAVKLTKLVVASIYNDDDGVQFGELQLAFDTETWDIDTHGLIYTDRRFMRELRKALIGLGFSQLAVNDICYSEQGMQGDDYVSFDISSPFIREFQKLAKG